MKVKVLLRLTSEARVFEISVDGRIIRDSDWEEGPSGYFEYRLKCSSGHRLQVLSRVGGDAGNSIQLQLLLEDYDYDLGVYPLRIETGGQAETSFTVAIPEPMFRMRTEDTYSIGDGEPEELEREAAWIDEEPEEPVLRKSPQAPAPPVQPGKPTAIHQDEDSGNYEVAVFYATDRDAHMKSGRLTFGHNRGALQYGKCFVNIPQNKALGELPRPTWWKLQFRENPDKHVMLLETVAQNKEDFFEELKATVAAATERDAFIFIHGFNVSFEEAVWRTAQITYDVGFGGAPIMYSWPSQSSLDGYFSDEDNVQYSHHSIVEFIKDVKERSGADKLHLIAHSMGNRALAGALVSLHEGGYFRDTAFDQIILAAPDIDAQIFINDIAPNLAGCSDRVTLYASSKDNALRASRDLRKNLRRAGDGGENIVCCSGIDTVDASMVDTDLLGHGYFAATRPLLEDMGALLQKGAPPPDRGLEPIHRGDRSYWSF